MAKKERLDLLVQKIEPSLSRSQIQSWIMQGKVKVDGVVVTKPGQATSPEAKIECDIHEQKYVSRAGFKMEKALEHFQVPVEGVVALDAGLSTGGFSDCLLQHGARKIYGIEVGYGQAHEKIRRDARVIVREKTNLKDVTDLGEQVDLITLDLSFISVLKVMDAVDRLLKPGGGLIVLIKPQFEAGRYEVGKGGIVSDPAIHERVVKEVTQGIEAHGYTCQGVIESPILGTEGNKEFLTYCIKK